MHTIAQTIFAVTLLGFAATARAQSPDQQPTQQQSPHAADECPDVLKGATLTMSNIDGGVQFRLTTPDPSNVAPLRTMLHEIENNLEQATAPENNPAGASSASANDPRQIPPLDVDVKNINSGALVTVKSNGAANIAKVRTQAKELQTIWQASACVKPQSQMPDNKTLTPKTSAVPM